MAEGWFTKLKSNRTVALKIYGKNFIYFFRGINGFKSIL
jgi:hypothetical protein